MILENRKKHRRLNLKKIKILDFDQSTLLEQETTSAILDNKNINFPKENYPMPQSIEQIKADKKDKIENYLKATAEYYSEEMQVTENLKDKDMAHLI